jgi:response regulator of citrate/malate metabolism
MNHENQRMNVSTKQKTLPRSILEQAFHEIMPEVEFVDVTPKRLAKQIGRSVVTMKNFLKSREDKKKIR